MGFVFITGIVVSMSWELTVILVFIFLMTDSIGLVFLILTDQTHFFFIEMFVFSSFAHFLNEHTWFIFRFIICSRQ